MSETQFYYRRGASILVGFIAAFFGYVTMTVPMISATAPAIITIALAGAAFFLWPRGAERPTFDLAEWKRSQQP